MAGMVMPGMVVVVIVAMLHSRRSIPRATALISSSRRFCLPSAVEIGGIEPFLIGPFQRRPFLVDDRIPRRVAVFALHHHVLAENALEREAEPHGGALRRLVAVVAFPLVAAVAELVEGVLHEQELRLGRRRLARHQRPPIDIADLDDAIGRVDAHQRLPAGDLAAGLVDDGEEQRVLAGLDPVQPGLEGGAAFRRKVGQPAEALAGVGNARRLVEAVAMPLGAERLQPDIAAFQRLARRAAAAAASS